MRLSTLGNVTLSRSLLVLAVAACGALAACSDDEPDAPTDAGARTDAGRDASEGGSREASSDAATDASSDAARDVSADGAAADAVTDVRSDAREAGATGADAPVDALGSDASDARDGGAPTESGSSVDAATTDAPPETGATAANRPARVDVTDALLARLQVPAGFRVRPFARGLSNPRMMAVAPDGSVYVTIPETNQVLRLFDANGNGTIEPPAEQSVVASRATTPELEGVHGITIHQGRVYLASIRNVMVGTLTGGTITGLTVLVPNLPEGGQHPLRTLAVGPDNNLYITVGSTCNACEDTNSENATFLRVNLDGDAANPANPSHPILADNPTAMVSERVFASGLRNTLGFDWHPTTGALWGFDQGSDGLGDQIPPEELNQVIGGRAYGWPYCWGNRQVDPQVEPPTPALSKELYCLNTEPRVSDYQAHSSPIGFLFYEGTQFPAAYRNDAFVAFRGSWNRTVAVGYKVVRVHFVNGVPIPAAGAASPYEDFLSGFLIDNATQFGRPTGLAVDASGALLVADDTNGIIYRVSYGEPDGGAAADSGAVDAGTDARAD